MLGDTAVLFLPVIWEDFYPFKHIGLSQQNQETPSDMKATPQFP
jgi:hypothetical protein